MPHLPSDDLVFDIQPGSLALSPVQERIVGYITKIAVGATMAIYATSEIIHELRRMRGKDGGTHHG